MHTLITLEAGGCKAGGVGGWRCHVKGRCCLHYGDTGRSIVHIQMRLKEETMPPSICTSPTTMRPHKQPWRKLLLLSWQQ